MVNINSEDFYNYPHHHANSGIHYSTRISNSYRPTWRRWTIRYGIGADVPDSIRGSILCR